MRIGIWPRAALLGLVVGAGAVGATTLELPDIGTLRVWLADAGGAGWALGVLGLAVLLLAPVPRSVLSVLLGLVAGFWGGLAVALTGGLLGALAAFGLARTLGRPAVARLAGDRAARVDRLALDRGFLAVLAGRLLPVVPFVVLSYGAGLTTVRPRAYTAATALGLLPSTVVQVGVGASAGAFAGGATTGTVAVVLAALVTASAAGLLLWGRCARCAVAVAAG